MYGRISGSYRVLDALTTLAFDYPPRARFFRRELKEFILLAREEKQKITKLKGSYAGAMGLGQFIPSSYRHYAVDFDKDGFRDIWNNPTDAIGSVANYLHEHGWSRDGQVTLRVGADKVPEDVFNVSLKPTRTISELQSMGMQWEVEDIDPDGKVSPMMLRGKKGKEFWVGLRNFYVITRYNRSRLYAMAVYQLSQRLKLSKDGTIFLMPFDSHRYERFGRTYDVMPTSLGYLEIGIASWYGKKFHGRLTSLGETYNMYAMTAAHRELPLPTTVKVTNLDNGRSVALRVNDRGPFHDDRLIDLSWGAAWKLGFEDKGTVPVVVEALDDVNYPDLDAKSVVGNATWLQVGAFSRKGGATQRLDEVVASLPPDIPARILTSGTATELLHKVWVGPLSSPDEEEIVTTLMQNRNLGSPLRVVIGN